MTFTSGLPPAGAPVSGMPTPVPVVVSGPGYSTVCPNCGQQLAPVALDPQAAPWLCNVCGRGWWVTELSVSARAGWDHGSRSFARALLPGLRASVDQELGAAVDRGTSALPEHLPLLDAGQLSALLRRLQVLFPPVVPPTPVPAGWVTTSPPAFVQLVEAAIASRKPVV